MLALCALCIASNCWSIPSLLAFARAAARFLSRSSVSSIGWCVVDLGVKNLCSDDDDRGFSVDLCCVRAVGFRGMLCSPSREGPRWTPWFCVSGSLIPDMVNNIPFALHSRASRWPVLRRELLSLDCFNSGHVPTSRLYTYLMTSYIYSNIPLEGCIAFKP